MKFLASVVLVLALMPGMANAVETEAGQAYLIDFETGSVLLNKNGDERMYPASMTKMMTAYMVFDHLKNGTLSLDDTLPVSKKAWKKGGSKMFVEVGKRIKIEDLLRGIIVQSGNDATIVVAEGLAGSVEAFARQMTEKAHEIGMKNTQFRNGSGWPDPEHYTTAHDLAVLARETIRNFPEYYHIYAEEAFTFSGISQSNRNPLIKNGYSGADGLKTGHTEASGYGLTASAKKDGRRLVLVVNGLDSERAREVESERLLTWGFREWNRYDLFSAGETVIEMPVWLGQKNTVPLIVEEPVTVTMRRRYRDDLKVKVQYTEPAPAPVKARSQLGRLIIEAPETDTRIVPLFAADSVDQLGAFGRVNAAFKYLLWGEN